MIVEGFEHKMVLNSFGEMEEGRNGYWNAVRDLKLYFIGDLTQSGGARRASFGHNGSPVATVLDRSVR
jgi:hypothetical protein